MNQENTSAIHNEALDSRNQVGAQMVSSYSPNLKIGGSNFIAPTLRLGVIGRSLGLEPRLGYLHEQVSPLPPLTHGGVYAKTSKIPLKKNRKEKKMNHLTPTYKSLKKEILIFKSIKLFLGDLNY